MHVVVMEKHVAGRKVAKFMNTLMFRLVLLLCGFVLILYYGILMPGAVVNLHSSWFGLIYCIFGIVSGILCIVYFFKKKKVLLVIVIPAIIFMMVTLINVKLGK